MSASICIKGNDITGKCQRKVLKNDGMIINRSDLMSTILKKGIDSYMKRQLSFVYEMILDMETENKTYITQIQIDDDSEKELLDFIKQEM